MTWFWTTGILIIVGVFAVLLFINPNLSWMAKRIPRPIRSIFASKKKENPVTTEDYGFALDQEKEEKGKDS